MIKHFNKRRTCTSCVSITFKDENGVGYGVTRDAFSAFYDKMYEKMEGSFIKVPTTLFSSETWETIGKIITHGFLLFNIFPVCVSKVTQKYYLFDGAVSDDEMLTSFKQYITQAEREMSENFTLENQQSLIDILSEYSIFQLPTKDNVDELLAKAADISLIRLPCFAIQAMIKGMGYFWKKITPDLFDPIYFCTTPTPENIISCLSANEVTKND